MIVFPTGGTRIMNTRHLTPKDITKIEEGMNSQDLEFMVAVIDRIVALKLAKALKTSQGEQAHGAD